MLHHPPRIFRPKGSVGVFGTNNSDDVKTLQRMIIGAGYNHIHGNNLHATGNCDPQTQAAIIWYQRLLNMSPSGLVHPQEIWFFRMFNQAIAPHWLTYDSGPLYVSEGQITFDAEGMDYLTAVEPFSQPVNTKNFSRILHWPQYASGVTLGRGYDMKERSPGQIVAELRQAGIEEYKAVICSKASGLSGKIATTGFIKAYGPLVGEITHLQQIKLFEISYRVKKNYAKGVYFRYSHHINNALSWANLEYKIRETFVDIVYQGIPKLGPLIELIAAGGSKQDMIENLQNDPNEKKYGERLRARIRNLQ